MTGLFQNRPVGGKRQSRRRKSLKIARVTNLTMGAAIEEKLSSNALAGAASAMLPDSPLMSSEVCADCARSEAPDGVARALRRLSRGQAAAGGW